MIGMAQLVLFFVILAIVVHEPVVLVSAGFCRANTSCAKGVRIDEPFWIGDGSPGEGCTNYPGFRVKCASDGTPVINISNGLYTVLSLSLGNIRVREADINGQECPQPLQNLSIGSPRFMQFYDGTKMRLFYNCSSPPPNIEALEIRCLEKHYSNSTKHSYAFPSDQIPEGFDWHGHCEKNVLTYIQDEGNPITNIAKALRQGIQLYWNTPVNCTDCVSSGGRCSSNETTGAISCYCSDDEQSWIDEICSRDYDGELDPRIITG